MQDISACNSAKIEIWDPLLRSFHWLLVAAFATAWWSEGHDIRIHLLSGTFLVGLLLFRLIWGFVGEHHARFASFRPNKRNIVQHMSELLHLKSGHYPGHTPIGSLMIYFLLLNLMILVISGMLLMALQMGIGPFSAWATMAGFETEILIGDIHHWCFNSLQILIAIHLTGVVAESLLQRSNLTLAMITGRKNIQETK